VRHFWHVGINVTDMDKSISFYERIGFALVQDKEVEDRNLAHAFMVDGAEHLRFAHMRLQESPDEAMLDLIEWIKPRSSGRAHSDLIHPGLCRFSILTDDVDREYNRLTAEGIEFLNRPETVLGPDRRSGWRLLFAHDPDGTLFHFVELVTADGKG
jgi:catechol 2,3-dioxygenase-like lactoylglutathione lyase family enzyme